MHKVAKISSKGQITLPKAVRDRLGVLEAPAVPSLAALVRQHAAA